CELVARGARIGVTANSHKVIRLLLDEAVKVADEHGLGLNAIQKVCEPEPGQGRITCTTKNLELFDALGASCVAHDRTSAIVRAGAPQPANPAGAFRGFPAR